MVGREDLPKRGRAQFVYVQYGSYCWSWMSGLLIAWLGIAPLFLINTLSFIPVLIGLASINNKELHPVLRVTRKQSNEHQNAGKAWKRASLIFAKHLAVFMVIAIAAGFHSWH